MLSWRRSEEHTMARVGVEEAIIPSLFGVDGRCVIYGRFKWDRDVINKYPKGQGQFVPKIIHYSKYYLRGFIKLGSTMG